jgi:hypothetical protein
MFKSVHCDNDDYISELIGPQNKCFLLVSSYCNGTTLGSLDWSYVSSRGNL